MADTLVVTIGDRTARIGRGTGGAFVVDADKGTVDDASAAIGVERGAAPSEFLVRAGQRQSTVFAVRVGDAMWLFHEGRVFEANVEAEGQSRRRSAHHHGALTAPMPATVIAVNVAPGDRVATGDILIVLEAMKMELPLRAQGEATVAAVHCRAGDLVQPNVPLIDLE